MKNLLLSAATAALVAVAVAPAARAQSVRFGLKAGGSLSNLSGDLANQDQYKNRFGLHGGAMLNVGLLDDDLLALQLEGLYSQKGFKYADQQVTVLGSTSRSTGSVRYDYIDVPLLLRVKTSGIFFEAGPQYSYLLNISTDRTRTVNGNVTSASNSTSDLSRTKRHELGYAAGLGFRADNGFLLGLRYNGAFTDFAKDGYSDNEFRNARHSTFQAYIGVLLGGK
jgi:hypothetical protein